MIFYPFFFFTFIFLSSAAPASSSTPVPLSHPDSEYPFSSSISLQVAFHQPHWVIIQLCWWKAAPSCREANKNRNRHRASQIHGRQHSPYGAASEKPDYGQKTLQTGSPRMLQPKPVLGCFVSWTKADICRSQRNLPRKIYSAGS